MAYRYSLRDENDPLLSLLDQGGSDNSPSLSEPYQQPPAADPGQQDDVLTSMLLDQGRPRGGAYQPSPAAASQNADRASLDAAWTQREREALDASKPQKYGVWEGLRDNAAPVLAGALDSIFNKGRGLGNIVQGAAGEVGAQQAHRDALRKQEGDLALKIRGKQGDDLAAQKLQYAYDALRAREGAAGGVQKRHDENVARADDPYSQRNATAEAMAFKLAEARKQGGLETGHDYQPMTLADQSQLAGGRSTASANAGEDVKHNYAPQDTADAADKARAVAYAGNEPKLSYESDLNPILEQRSQASANSGVGAGLSAESIAAANPRLSVSDVPLLQQALKTRTVNQKTLEDIKAANRGAEVVQRLHDTAAEYQALDVSDMMGEKGAELRRQFDGHAEEYAGVIGRLSGNASIETHREALGLVPSIHNPYATAGIKGLWSPLEANINGNLGSIGITAAKPSFLQDGGGAPQAAAPAKPMQPGEVPPERLPGKAAAMGDNYQDFNPGANGLGVTGGGRNSAPMAPKASVTRVRKPDGTVVESQLPLDQLANLPQGWELVR